MNALLFSVDRARDARIAIFKHCHWCGVYRARTHTVSKPVSLIRSVVFACSGTVDSGDATGGHMNIYQYMDVWTASSSLRIGIIIDNIILKD